MVKEYWFLWRLNSMGYILHTNEQNVLFGLEQRIPVQVMLVMVDGVKIFK